MCVTSAFPTGWVRTAHYAGILVAGLLLLTSCSDNTRVAGPPPDGTEVSLSAVGTPTQYTLIPERPLEQISELAPSFGGFFLEEGNLVAYATDLNEADAVRVAIESVIPESTVRAHHDGNSQPSILIRRGEFSFAQLREWRDLATANVFELPDAVSVDLDEGRNRLAIGLETGVGQLEIARELVEHGIPREAVTFEVTGRMTVDSQTLWDSIRPLVGGIRIAPGYCTIGFNALRYGQEVFVTDSHCTAQFWSTDGTVVYQPDTSPPSNRIGHEIYDPPPFQCTPVFPCRYSDATIILHESTDLHRGYIARTEYAVYGTGGVGSLDIDPDHPLWRIDHEGTAWQGEYVHKVGQASGWTSGTVQKTCSHHFISESGSTYLLLCQYAANYGRREGDSGSPVFHREGSGVRLLGIHRGVEGETGLGVFGSIAGVKQDLGVMSIVAPAPPPPMTVEIRGDDHWPAYQVITVQAIVFHGTPPFTYEWEVNGSPACGNQNYCSATMGAPHSPTFFFVRVTDANQDQAIDYHQVTAQ
jgi:hypothetical protein